MCQPGHTLLAGASCNQQKPTLPPFSNCWYRSCMPKSNAVSILFGWIFLHLVRKAVSGDTSFFLIGSQRRVDSLELCMCAVSVGGKWEKNSSEKGRSWTAKENLSCASSLSWLHESILTYNDRFLCSISYLCYYILITVDTGLEVGHYCPLLQMGELRWDRLNSLHRVWQDFLPPFFLLSFY